MQHEEVEGEERERVLRFINTIRIIIRHINAFLLCFFLRLFCRCLAKVRKRERGRGRKRGENSFAEPTNDVCRILWCSRQDGASGSKEGKRKGRGGGKTPHHPLEIVSHVQSFLTDACPFLEDCQRPGRPRRGKKEREGKGRKGGGNSITGVSPSLVVVYRTRILCAEHCLTATLSDTTIWRCLHEDEEGRGGKRGGGRGKETQTSNRKPSAFCISTNASGRAVNAGR